MKVKVEKRPHLLQKGRRGPKLGEPLLHIQVFVLEEK